MTAKTPQQLFDLTGKVAVITGGSGFLGQRHAETIAAAGGTPVIIDIESSRSYAQTMKLQETYGVPASALVADIADETQVEELLRQILAAHGRIDILVNNAANNPKVEDPAALGWSRFENFPLGQWDADLRVGLTGTFICCKVFGSHMVRQGGGSIINIASIYGVIAPDQRLYRIEGLAAEDQPTKPVSYTVVKSAILGLTMYLSVYWAPRMVRVNSISPGGIYNGQLESDVKRLSDVVPLGRMAEADELSGALLYLSSSASSYVTGLNLLVDGGRSCW